MRVRVVTIVCRCGNAVAGAPGENTRQLRDRLEDAGWFTEWRQDFDLCPACLDVTPQHRVAECPGCGRRFSVRSF